MQTRPRLLDLFCGAGGCSVGYARAGFEVVGVDINQQPNYTYEFIRADAIGAMEHLAAGWGDFHAIHASPPCQAHTQMNNFGTMGGHPDLIGPVRELLVRSGLPYIIENVEGAPLLDPITLCGSSFGLGVRRHRLLESNMPLVGSDCDHESQPVPIPVVGHGAPSSFRKRHGYSPTVAESKEAMGIDWMTRDELSQAIPPAYTEFIGKQVLDFLNERNMPTMESRSG